MKLLCKQHVTRLRRLTAVGSVSVLVGTLLFASGGSTAFAAARSDDRMQVFAEASAEFQVPKEVLLAVSYNQSRWISYGTEASVDNGYGLMNLRTKAQARAEDGRGNAKHPLPQKTEVKASRYTLDDASRLLKAAPEKLKSDERQNVRGAAVVLADYARKHNDGKLPASLNDWYAAVADFSGATNRDSAQSFADDVYSTMEQGVSETTKDGQRMALEAKQDLSPQRDVLSQLKLPEGPLAAKNITKNQGNVDCPSALNCRFVPAGYAANSADPADFGNYDPANRPKDMKIKYIVIHDTEGSYQSAIDHFQDTSSYVSAHYVIRSNDGAVTQMVRTSDVAWTAGDWYVNMHSINIEHEGFANQGTWYTEAMYRSSAKLVRHLAAKYNIPLDREHIIGHSNVPTLSPARMAGQHTDPGPYWDWDRYMHLLQAPTNNGPEIDNHTKTLTIAPKFAANQPPITDCSSGTCVDLAAQGSNRVYLRTAPQASAPLLSDPYAHTDNAPGTTRIDDWSAVVESGQQFAVAGQQGDWTAIWFGGKKGWFFNPDGSKRTARASWMKTVTPKSGKTSVPVYGAAYPESEAYPATIPVQDLIPLYQMPEGQKYVTSGKVPTNYFYDATINYSLPDDHMVVKGDEAYYQVSFNHKLGYVKAADVDVKAY